MLHFNLMENFPLCLSVVWAQHNPRPLLSFLSVGILEFPLCLRLTGVLCVVGMLTWNIKLVTFFSHLYLLSLLCAKLKALYTVGTRDWIQFQAKPVRPST